MKTKNLGSNTTSCWVDGFDFSAPSSMPDILSTTQSQPLHLSVKKVSLILVCNKIDHSSKKKFIDLLAFRSLFLKSIGKSKRKTHQMSRCM